MIELKVKLKDDENGLHYKLLSFLAKDEFIKLLKNGLLYKSTCGWCVKIDRESLAKLQQAGYTLPQKVVDAIKEIFWSADLKAKAKQLGLKCKKCGAKLILAWNNEEKAELCCYECKYYVIVNHQLQIIQENFTT